MLVMSAQLQRIWIDNIVFLLFECKAIHLFSVAKRLIDAGKAEYKKLVWQISRPSPEGMLRDCSC